jgi:hypothetical protein
MGRVNRRREKQHGLADVHVLGVPTKCLPYNREILQSTMTTLPDNGTPLEAYSLQSMIDKVYPIFNPMAIEANLAWNSNGIFTKRALCNGSNTLMELLAVDTVSAILNHDYGAYLEAIDFMERRMLEIPVPSSAKFRNLPNRIIGTDKIYIVDQALIDYEKYGLRLNNNIDTQDSNII